mgnify:CR=1 FL=1
MPAAFDPATLDWNLLRALGAVLDLGSLTQAAARLGTSQPTLSRQIAMLEAQLERAAKSKRNEAILQAPIDSRRALYGRVVLSGGSTWSPGLSTKPVMCTGTGLGSVTAALSW